MIPPKPPVTPPVNPPQHDAAQQETNRIFHALEAIFVRPWCIYQDSRSRNERALALKKLSSEAFTEAATKNAQMEIDLEVPADRQQLQSLICKQTDDANKKLAAQVKKLERQLGNLAMTKNPPRGQNTTGGASSTKRKSQPPSWKKNDARGADTSTNSSNDDKSGNKVQKEEESLRHQEQQMLLAIQSRP
jgi:hypothetical protein